MTMYDKLGSLLSEALEKGELPKKSAHSPLSDDFFETPKQAQESFSTQENQNSPPKVKVFTFRKASPHKKDESQYQIIKDFKPIPEQVKSALAFIQIPETSDFETAKKIYREKLMYYHPDRRNDNPILQKVAKEKTERLLHEWKILEDWYQK